MGEEIDVSPQEAMQVVGRLQDKIVHHKEMLASEYGTEWDKEMVDHLNAVLTGEG